MGTDCEGLAGDSELGFEEEEEEEQRDRWGNEGLERQWRRAWERRTLRAAISESESESERRSGFWKWGLVNLAFGFWVFPKYKLVDYGNAFFFLFSWEILQFSIFTNSRGIRVFGQICSTVHFFWKIFSG